VSTAILDPVGRVRRARRRPARRHAVVLGVLAAALLGALAVRVLLGDYLVTLPDLVRIVRGADIPGASFIVTESKLPRAVLGALAGAGFGVAGAIFQTVLRNPLASPDVVGVSVGASAAAVFGIVVAGLSGAPLAGCAIAGAVAVSLAVRFAAGGRSGYRLVLVGVAAAALLQSVIQYLFTRADIYDAQAALVWLTGSLNGADWPTIDRLGLALVVLLVPAVALARSLRIGELGEDTARGLGVPPWRTDALLLVAVLVVAVCVAATGPIAFASFLAGPIARALDRGRASLPSAALVGAVIVVAADHVAAYGIPGANLPVGVVTGACGAPFLLWLLARGALGRTGGPA
jgi:iron complex transport system permease protein